MRIENKLRQTPSSPGIYIMKNARNKVIYVGKAKNLRNRLRSYFHNSASLDARKSRMVNEIRDFDYIVTGNELEALALEANFIKSARPRYNIVLRDDKNYPYLKLTVNEEWPGLEVVRKIKNDGAEYFGPYIPAVNMWEMVKFIRRNFPIRMCRYNLGKPFRPCVQYQMGRCLAPCSESFRTEEDRKKYMEVVNEVRSFILGEKKELLSSLRARMQRYSDEQKFEQAAEIRDSLKALEKAWESQRVIAPELGDMDVIGLYREADDASLFLFIIRNGSVVGRKDFFLKDTGGTDTDEIISSFIEQFYSKEILLPSRIIVPVRSRLTIQKQWLSRRKGQTVRLSGARNDLEAKVLKMAEDNALYSLNAHRETRVDRTLMDIKDLLGLDIIPNVIGAVDISNLSGADAVGVIIIYENGTFLKDEYRVFRIKTVKGANDFAMIGEVAGRHLKRKSENNEELPQLLLIDGGAGQLKYAQDAIRPFDVPVELAAIAKAKKGTSKTGTTGIRREIERVYLPDRKRPVYLEPGTNASLLLQKIRDEAHRFAIYQHKKLRTRKTLESPLEKVKGIGKTRRLLLLKHFGTVDRIKEAPVSELSSLKGMNRKAAENLKRALKQR